jgi:SulP family sulfate permease
MSFVRMKQLAQSKAFVLVFTRLSETIQSQLAAGICFGDDKGLFHIETDLDHGVEWCEDQIIAEQLAEKQSPKASRLAEPAHVEAVDRDRITILPGAGPPSPEDVARASWPAALGQACLAEYFECWEVPAETHLIKQEQPVNGLFLVKSGQVTAQRECDDGSTVRLRKMGPGSVVGEMGLYLGTPASASVVTDRPSTIYYLSAGELERMERTEPETAAAFHRYIARTTGERLSRANDTLQALLE